MNIQISFYIRVLVLYLCITGCSNNGDDANSAVLSNMSKTLRYPMTTDPATLDPAKVEDQDTYDLIIQCFDTLMQIDENGKVIPQLAESIVSSQGGRKYTVKLKRNVTYHGTARQLKADDVIWTLNRNCSPEMASPVADAYLGIIEGVKEKLAGKADQISGLEKLDDFTVVFTLKEPAGYFPGLLTYPVSAPLPKGLVPETEMTSVKDVVGTGPFQLVNYQPNSIVELTANTKYHGGAPKLDGIQRLVLKDPNTRLNKYKKGELDFLCLERQDIEVIQNDPRLSRQLHTFARPSLFFIGLNQNIPGLKDKKVRQALAYSVEKAYIVNRVLGGVHIPADGLLPPSFPGYRDKVSVDFSFNSSKAKQLLEEAGYGPGKKKLEISISYRNDKTDLKIFAEAIHALWKRILDIDVKLVPTEWTQFIQKLDNKNETMVIMRWLNDYPDPQNTLSMMFHSSSENNWFNYKNQEVDMLCDKADRLSDQNQRMRLYQKAEDIILDDVVWIPIYFQQDMVLIQDNIKGIRDNSFCMMPHNKVVKN